MGCSTGKVRHSIQVLRVFGPGSPFARGVSTPSRTFYPFPSSSARGRQKSGLSLALQLLMRTWNVNKLPWHEERVTVSEQEWILINTRASSGLKAVAVSSPQWWYVTGEETETLSLEALKLELSEKTQGALLLLKGAEFTCPKEHEEVKWPVGGHN